MAFSVVKDTLVSISDKQKADGQSTGRKMGFSVKFHRDVKQNVHATAVSLSRDVSDGFSLGWAENILEELFDLVDVGLDLAVEGYEWGVRARRQVLEVCGLPGREVEPLQISGENGSDHHGFNL